MNTWRQRIASILEWSDTDKGMLPVIMLLLTNSQYLLWAQYALHRPDSDKLIHTTVMHELLFMELCLTLGAAVLLVIGLLLRRKHPDLLIYQLVTAMYFGLTLVAASSYIGTLHIAAGVVLLGGPVFGFIVLDRKVVWTTFISSLAALATLSYLSAIGTIPYASAFKTPTDVSSELFWTTSSWLFAAPHIIFIILIADQTLNRWRKREDTIRELSRTDGLTGTHNRRSIIEMLDKETARTHRHGPPLCVVLLDLDHFKKINDTWGHPMGDRVLIETARLLRSSIRQCDAVGRYGGEEFLLLLPDTSLPGASTLVERCRANLAELVITSDSGERIPVSGSFGLVCNEHYLSASTEMLIKEADDALYRAKEGGRNCVVALDMHSLGELQATR